MCFLLFTLTKNKTGLNMDSPKKSIKLIWLLQELILDHWTNIWSNSMHLNTYHHLTVNHWTDRMIMKMKNEKTRLQVLLQMHFSSPLSASRSHCWRGNLRHWIYIQDHVICLEEAECSRTAPWIPSESHWSLQTNQKGVVNTILKLISSPICSERPCEMFYC